MFISFSLRNDLHLSDGKFSYLFFLCCHPNLNLAPFTIIKLKEYVRISSSSLYVNLIGDLEILAPGEKPLAEILQGKNPILFCHEAAKFHHLKLDFDPVSETGGQFTWSLTMGEMNTEGLGKSRKIAKIRAAEEMVRLLDLTYPGRVTY